MRQCLLLGLLLAPVASAAAQVGFLPSQSPYHDLLVGQFIEVSGGRIGGGGGLLDLGPRNGPSDGVRVIFRANHSLQFSFGAWTAGLQRTWIDAYDSVAIRNKGLVDQRLIAGEFGVQLNATGGKTWHGFAPFLGVGLGLVHGSASPPTDTSGYSFGSKLYVAPDLGTRFYIGQRIYLKVDVRALLWNLVYPPSYALEPASIPGTAANPNANAVNPSGATSQYTVTPEIRFGIGIHW